MKDLVELRREFHRHGESGWTEFYTTARIIAELQSMGIPVRWGSEIHCPEKMVGLPPKEMLEECWQRAATELGSTKLLEPMRGGFTGCIAEIKGSQPGPLTVIRVDIDCCDVPECAEVSHRPAREGFASIHENCMHACGHDAHAAIGIGAAERIWAGRQKLRGSVRIIFQGAEEGLRGAVSMTAAGAVDGAERLFGIHVGIVPGEIGSVAVSAKGFLSAGKFDVIFHGLAAHAGICPEKGRNALAAAAKATLELLELPKEFEELCRVNVGTLHAGSGRNVVPALAQMGLETRGERAQVNAEAEKMAMEICRTAGEKYGCTVEIRKVGGAGGADCDMQLARKAAEILRGVPGVKEVLEEVPFCASEDVTTMIKAVQAQGGQATELILPMPLPWPHHNSSFDIDEAVLPLGADILAALALEI